MKVAYLVLENRCNLACPYCFYVQRGDRWSKDRMEVATVQTVVEQLAAIGFEGVAFTGGEPTMHPDVVRCVAAAKLAGMQVWLATNGTLLNDGLCQDLRSAGLDYVYLSSNTAVEIEDALTRLRAAIEQLRAAGLNRIHLTWVISRPQREILESVRTFAIRQAVDVVFQPAWLVREGERLSRMNAQGLRQITPTIVEWAKESGHVRYGQLMLGYYHRDDRPRACTMGSASIIVDWNGQVYPCFHRRDLCAGNVHDAPVATIVENIRKVAVPTIEGAGCFGERCISLFAR